MRWRWGGVPGVSSPQQFCSSAALCVTTSSSSHLVIKERTLVVENKMLMSFFRKQWNSPQGQDFEVEMMMVLQ
jgi:hypothetical protein